MRSGFVTIIGRPNAGKSSLLNKLLDEKISIISPKAQTTRNTIVGIYNNDDTQIVFYDTPGIHDPRTHLGTYMNKTAYGQTEGVDIIYYIADAVKGLQEEDQKIITRIDQEGAYLFLLLNKIDRLSKVELIQRINYAASHYQFAEIIPISALKGENLNELLNTTIKYLKDDLLYYPKDIKSTVSMNFRIAELIREKILEKCREEVPHLVAVKVEKIEEDERHLYIDATIVCNKPNHKAIIIGKNGSNLKAVNMAASKDIKALYHKKVSLSLFVKVETDWFNRDKELYDLGYFIDNE